MCGTVIFFNIFGNIEKGDGSIKYTRRWPRFPWPASLYTAGKITPASVTSVAAFLANFQWLVASGRVIRRINLTRRMNQVACG